MEPFDKLVEALRILQDKNSLSYYKRQVCKDAADAIEELQQKWFKSETDATNLTGRLAQAEADVERLNLEIDKRIATEIELSNQVDALQAEVDKANKSADAYRAMYFAKRGDITIEKVRELDEIDCHFHSALIRLMYKRIEELESEKRKMEVQNADTD